MCIRDRLTAETMPLLTGEQHSLLAYQIFRDELMEGGFCQLIRFEEETGYTVIMDYFDTNEEMYPVVKNKTAQYDVICASDYMINKMIEEDLLETIDFRYIPNIENLQENVRNFVDDFDPGMRYCVPHTWGTYGILYNKTMITEPIESWEIGRAHV